MVDADSPKLTLWPDVSLTAGVYNPTVSSQGKPAAQRRSPLCKDHDHRFAAVSLPFLLVGSPSAAVVRFARYRLQEGAQ